MLENNPPAEMLVDVLVPVFVVAWALVYPLGLLALVLAALAPLFPRRR